MRYGTKSGPEYFDDYDPKAPATTVHRPTPVVHRPELDDLHRRIHAGAIGIIRTYRNDPRYTRLVLNARRLLEHDITNARNPEQHAQYTADLTKALADDSAPGDGG